MKTSKHHRYPRRFRWFMRGDYPCRYRLPWHRWRLQHDFTAKNGIAHGLWVCRRCGTMMNTKAWRA